MRRRWMASVLVVTTAVALGACGGDDDDGGGGGGGGGLSLQELTKETAGICRDANRQIRGVEQPNDIRQPEQAAAFFEQLLEINQDGLRKLRALEPADDLKPEYDRFVTAIADQTEFIDGILEKAKARDPSGLQDLQEQIETPTLQRNIKATARDLGLDRCAKELD
jgi:hypothetical protein